MVAASPASEIAARMYCVKNKFFHRFETRKRLPDDRQIEIGGAHVVVFGMGRVGTGAYDNLLGQYGSRVIGIDADPSLVKRHIEKGRHVIAGDAEDYDFWQRGIGEQRQITLILLTMSHAGNLAAAKQIASFSLDAVVGAVAAFDDEVELLKAAGADMVFNLYAEAGAGFSDHICEITDQCMLGE